MIQISKNKYNWTKRQTKAQQYFTRMINQQSKSQSTSKLIQNQEQMSSSSGFTYLLSIKDLKDYFRTIKISSISQKKSDFYTYQLFINITQQIYNEQTYINSISTNIDSLLVKQRITEQEEKAKQLNAKRQQIMQQLFLLDDQVSRSKRQKNLSRSKINLSMDVSRVSSKDNQEENDLSGNGNTKKLIFSKEEHKKLIHKIVKEREERQKNKLLLKEKEEEKLKKIQEEQKQLQLKKLQEEKRKKAEEIQEKLKKQRQMHEKFLEDEKQSQKKMQQIKHRKFLYEEINEKFELKVRMPLLQEQKKILKEKRQFAKAYSIDEIKSHQKAYIELRQNSMKKSQTKQIVKPIPHSESNIKAPSKSSRLQKILQEQKLQQRKKLMQKKRAIEQKLQRQQNYVQYLKENFSRVKIDKSKEEQVKKRIEKMTVRRQEVDFKAIGMNYLQIAKKKRRKTTANHQSEPQKQETSNNLLSSPANITALSESSMKKPQSESRLMDDARRNNLIKRRQQKIQTLINDSTLNQNERIRKLKLQTQKINEAFKMKEEMLKYGYSEKVEEEAVELLLQSIQAKMGIIDITKDKKEGVVVGDEVGKKL